MTFDSIEARRRLVHGRSVETDQLVDRGGVEAPVCKASGIGRLYDIGMTCGLGEYTEVNDILTGITTYTIGNRTEIVATGTGGTGPGTPPVLIPKTFDHAALSSTTNWRQE